jgi:hypothetical protein
MMYVGSGVRHSNFIAYYGLVLCALFDVIRSALSARPFSPFSRAFFPTKFFFCFLFDFLFHLFLFFEIYPLPKSL